MKQRLVGMIVLGSLALIIIPLLLDGEGVEPPPLTLGIPPAPQVDTTPIPDPVRPLILADQAEPQAAVPAAAIEEAVSTLPPAMPPADSTEDTAAAAVAARSETVPARDAQGLPEAWSVRLGVFADRANAEALVARLLAAGQKAYLQEVTTGQGSMSGVFVGPVLTKREADTLQQQLANSVQETGIVQQFRIEP